MQRNCERKGQFMMDIHPERTICTNVHGGYIDIEPRRSKEYPEGRRITPSVWSQNLKALRVSNNLSQADVAKILHCSQVAYGMYELGKRKLPVEYLIQLAKFYQVSLDELTGLAQK